ncbi:autoinducer binding domain-containing protein [Planktotalea sp.]|uniref:autoinducer binding domain-containing protein n=1 Tax=Planktotalea sp. TaxID=2029877 RepID=UPI003D6C1FFE
MKNDRSQQLLDEISGYLNSISSHGFTLGVNFLAGTPTHIVSTWNEDWLNEYQNGDFVLYDPVVIWGMSNEGIRSWNQLSKLFPSPEVNVISTARERGMPNGSVISLTVNRKRTILGISHEESELDLKTQDYVVSQMAKVAFWIDDPREIKLSYKSLQYLNGLAEGLNEREIATSAGVTPGAIRQLRNRVLKKLDAKTPAEAVLIAYKSRLVD